MGSREQIKFQNSPLISVFLVTINRVKIFTSSAMKIKFIRIFSTYTLYTYMDISPMPTEKRSLVKKSKTDLLIVSAYR